MLLPGSSIFYDGTPQTYSTWGPWPGFVSADTADAQSILNIADTDPNVVGAFGFEYQTYDPDGQTASGVWVGADDPTMATMLSTFVNFGQKTMGRSFTRPSEPAGSIVKGEPVEFVNSNSGMCLDVSGVSETVGTLMHQYSCLGSGQLNQMWKVYEVSSGKYQLTSLNDNVSPYGTFCLDLENGATANGSAVQQAACATAGTDLNQLWNLVPLGAGYEVVSAASGNCLDVHADSTASGAQVYTWQCLGSISRAKSGS